MAESDRNHVATHLANGMGECSGEQGRQNGGYNNIPMILAEGRLMFECDTVVLNTLNLPRDRRDSQTRPNWLGYF